MTTCKPEKLERIIDVTQNLWTYFAMCRQQHNGSETAWFWMHTFFFNILIICCSYSMRCFDSMIKEKTKTAMFWMHTLFFSLTFIIGCLCSMWCFDCWLNNEHKPLNTSFSLFVTVCTCVCVCVSVCVCLCVF